MTSTGNWESALAALLDAVPPDADRFVLALLAQQDADGTLFKDLLPDDALQRMNNEYLDDWWANTDRPQGAAWIRRGWRVLWADTDALTITFALFSEGKPARQRTRAMTAADVTDFFLILCERADNSVAVDLDALAIGETLGIHAPTVFAHVHELKVRGWIADAPPNALGGRHVRLTAAGASRSGSERIRRAGIAGRKAV